MIVGSATGCGFIPTVVDVATGDEDPFVDALGVGSTSATLEKACTDGKAFAKAQCDRGQRCATNDAYWFWSWGTGEQCEHNVASWYVGVFAITGTDERVKACQRELEAPDCGPTPACADLSREKRREEGVECSRTDDCKVGLACIDGSCGARKAEGASCDDSDECSQGLSCQKEVCKPVVDGTTACRSSDDCSVTRDSESGGFFMLFSSARSDRFYCDDTTLKCRSVVRDREQGESCGEGRLCVDGLYCKGRLLNGEGLCTRQIAFGEKCEDREGCFSCEDGVCKDPLEGTCK
ncbi:MAG: hypothetical protein KIT84_36615 [Labilithrix sp.]|nr:hypothetical protein [Labilithrix sp.]MCW5816580.1 hypothetical protein [Labilithrix sp.]